MGLIYQLQYEEHVVHEDIQKLSSAMKERIQESILKKLLIHPEIFGKPLRHSAKGYRKLRVGDYRVVFRLEGVFVKIFAIGHRSMRLQNFESETADLVAQTKHPPSPSRISGYGGQAPLTTGHQRGVLSPARQRVVRSD